MELNKEYYSGEIELNQYLTRGTNFRGLYDNGVLEFNKPIDKSIFLFKCYNDILSVPRIIRLCGQKNTIQPYIDDDTSEVYKFDVNHYFLTCYTGGDLINPDNNYLFESFAYSSGDTYTTQKVGMNVNARNTIPQIAPIVKAQTKYLIMLICCSTAKITQKVEQFDGRYLIRVEDIQTEVPIDTVLGYDDSWWDNHIVTTMFPIMYVGTHNQRTDTGYIRVASSWGNKPLEYRIDPEWEFPYARADEIKTSSFLLPAVALGANRRSGLCQGSGPYSPPTSYVFDWGSNKISDMFIMPYCNPSFWDIFYYARSGTSGSIMAGITDKLRFYSAFWAYRSVGLWFTGNPTRATSADLDNPDDYDDIYRGNWTPDGAVDSNKNAGDGETPKDGGLSDNPDNYLDVGGYDGDDTVPEIDPNTYTDETPLASPKLSPVDVFNRSFAMTAVQIRALADFLWNADDDKMTEIIEGLKLYGENPLNGLIDCRLYPFDLSSLSSSAERIIIGRVTTDVYGRKMQNDATYVMDLGSCTFFKHFKNYLDYSPYTEGRLFLPYCGMVPIDTAEFMGHEISAKLIVDVITGACCCCVYCDDILIVTANGVCGCEISMTGTDSASYANAVVSSFANGIMSIVGAGAGVAGGAKLASVGSSMMKSTALTNSLSNDRLSTYNKGLGIQQAGRGAEAASVGSGITSALQSFWELQTTPVQYAQRGSSTPSCETWLPQYPYFIIDRPIPNIPNGYGHNVGFACIETGPLSNFSGFTICSNVDTSGFAQATEAERSELKMLLEAGVFL